MLHARWLDPPPQVRPAADTLELELPASSRLRIARAVLAGTILLYCVELLLCGHWLVASGVTLSAASGLWPRRAARPQRLRIDPAGRLWLQWAGACWEHWQLDPVSMRCGAHLLLVMRGGRGRQRLLLGPDNVPPAALAALHRRLLAGPARATTALHSVAAPGSHPSDLP